MKIKSKIIVVLLLLAVALTIGGQTVALAAHSDSSPGANFAECVRDVYIHCISGDAMCVSGGYFKCLMSS